jgi:hypothetical protein
MATQRRVRFANEGLVSLEVKRVVSTVFVACCVSLIMTAVADLRVLVGVCVCLLRVCYSLVVGDATTGDGGRVSITAGAANTATYVCSPIGLPPPVTIPTSPSPSVPCAYHLIPCTPVVTIIRS